MTDYPKHERPEMRLFISQIEEARYQAFKARLIKELIAENAAGNTSGFLPLFDAENKSPHNLAAAELQADAGRATRHAEHCMAQFNPPAFGQPYNCTCDRRPKLVDSAR